MTDGDRQFEPWKTRRSGGLRRQDAGWLRWAWCCLVASLTLWGAVAAADKVEEPVNPWATGGAPAKPADAGGQSPAAPGAIPVSQAYAVPTAVIQGGAIPPGWQPQAIPYQAIGADGKPVTVHVAPTYVFTYVAGPPVAQMPVPRQVNRIQAGPPPAWNYQTRGAPVAATSLSPVTRSASVPYQYPAGAAALAGQAVVPPASPASPPAPMVAMAPPPPGQAAIPPPPAALQAPPTQWVSAPTGAFPSTGDPGVPANEIAAPAAIAGAAAVGTLAATDAAPTASIAAPAATPPLAPVSTAAPPPPADPAPPVASPQAPSAPQGSTHVWRVVGVHDGDTLTCLDETNTQQKVRLAEIDAPELGQDYGKVARESLAEMVFGKTVTVTEEGKDRYGRWIVHMQCNGLDVNRQMVATGNAWHYADYSRDPSLATLQTEAQTRRLGLWSQPAPVAPWDFRQTVKKAAAG